MYLFSCFKITIDFQVLESICLRNIIDVFSDVLCTRGTIKESNAPYYIISQDTGQCELIVRYLICYYNITFVLGVIIIKCITFTVN